MTLDIIYIHEEMNNSQGWNERKKQNFLFIPEMKKMKYSSTVVTIKLENSRHNWRTDKSRPFSTKIPIFLDKYPFK